MKPLLDYVLRSRPAMAGQFAKNMFKRRNTPSGAENQVRLDGLPAKGRPDRLWVVDRILEPQTVVHFFEFTMNGKLPSGLRTALPLVTLKELMLLYKPMSAWAPAPFNKQGRPLAEMIMSRIGSFEDPIRMKLISKELMAMKSRIWEGIMPVSERRWVELGLDSPSQFHQACQFIAGVTDVFHYLNLRLVKTDLRDTYNLIWSHLDEFDKALKAVEDNSSPAPSFAALWHEYICDRYDYIAQRSHHWVIEHVERLRAPIFKQLANDVVRPPDGGYTPLELELADKLHDLAENASHADNAIFLPTDGYLGGNLPPEDDVEVDGTRIRSEPIRYSANPLARKTDHVLRMRYLTYSRIFAEIAKGITRDATIEETATDQVRKQLQTRQELRGPETRKSGPERWAAHVNGCLEDGNPVAWGYIGYRTCYSHSDDEWQQFTAKFEADIANWGSELQDTAGLRKLCKVEWRDVGEAVAASDNDSIVAAQKAFETQAGDKEAMKYYHSDIFLVADKTTIDSYLHPADGDTGHVLAVEREGLGPRDHDHAEESPGFEGWLRIPGSLLWDDVGPLLHMQSQTLEDLWPLAQNDEQNVYRHSLGPVKDENGPEASDE